MPRRIRGHHFRNGDVGGWGGESSTRKVPFIWKSIVIPGRKKGVKFNVDVSGVDLAIETNSQSSVLTMRFDGGNGDSCYDGRGVRCEPGYNMILNKERNGERRAYTPLRNAPDA